MGRLEQFHGAGDIEKMFPEGAPRTVVPWPQATGRKGHDLYDRDLVREHLASNHPLTMVDPRDLRATQPFLVRSAMAHYLDPANKESGETYADKGNVGNRTPTIYRRGETNIILSGHHRAATALLQGQQFPARVITGGYGQKR